VIAAAWVDGALVPPDEARVSAFDHGLTVGDGVFETLRVYRRTPFALTRHLDRLAFSAGGLGLRLPPADLLRRAAHEVVEAAGLAEARLRVTVTGGPAPLGSGRGDARPTVLAAVAPLDPYPPATDVITVPWTRNERSALAGMKTTSYGENVVALAAAASQGAGEAVFANTRGELCEGTGTNVFLARGGRLMTPPLSSGCLAGITRALVLEHTAAATEATVALSALTGADEAFLTSSTREVQPIAAVDGRPLPQVPGPLTRAAMGAYADLLSRHLDP
jgi:branched-chain amino acid aminotransferase